MPIGSIIGPALRRSLFAVASHAAAQQSLFLGRSKVHALSVGRPRSSPEQAVPDDAALVFVGAADDGRAAPVKVLRRTTDRPRVGGCRHWHGIAGRNARGHQKGRESDRERSWTYET